MLGQLYLSKKEFASFYKKEAVISQLFFISGKLTGGMAGFPEEQLRLLYFRLIT